MTIHTMLRAGVGGLILTLVVASASSAGVSVFDAGLIIGIDALDIDSILYDVRFHEGSFNDNFTSTSAPSPVPTFWGDVPGAIAAGQAIKDHLNSILPTVPTGVGPEVDSVTNRNVFIPVGEGSDGTGFFDVVQVFNGGTGWGGGTGVLQNIDAAFDFSNANFATFTPSAAVVPVPGAFILGLTGLLTGSAMRNRKTQIPNPKSQIKLNHRWSK